MVVADAKSLLEQSNTAGVSDGVLLGRSDGKPLNVDLKTVNHVLMVPEHYSEMVEAYANKIRNFGGMPFTNRLVFKSEEEIKILNDLASRAQFDLKVQHEMAHSLGLSAQPSPKVFEAAPQTVKTKTSIIQMSVDKDTRL